jgi:hypothetical protein
VGGAEEESSGSCEEKCPAEEGEEGRQGGVDDTGDHGGGEEEENVEQAKETGRREEYEDFDKKVKKMIRRAKSKFEKKLAEGGNSKPFYAYLKKRTKGRAAVGPLKDENRKIITEDGEMAEVLNRFFSSVFTRDVDGQDGGGEGVNPPNPPPKMGRMVITEAEVRKKIRKLGKEAAAGPDEMGPRLLQELENEIAWPLTIIFRASLVRGEVPDDWRTANVTPIFKKGSKADTGNYRPVSLTSVCCKIMESMIRDKMMNHLESHGLINESQHGFMNGRSCCTNLLEFLETVTDTLDKGGGHGHHLLGLRESV